MSRRATVPQHGKAPPEIGWLGSARRPGGAKAAVAGSRGVTSMFETGSSRRWRISRTALVLAQALFLSVSLLGPAFVSAADPSADPSGTPPPTAEPTAEPTAAPTAEPTRRTDARPDSGADPRPDSCADPRPDSCTDPRPDRDPRPDPTRRRTPDDRAASSGYIVTFATGTLASTQASHPRCGRRRRHGFDRRAAAWRSSYVAASARRVVADLRADGNVSRVEADRVRDRRGRPE